MMTPLAKQQIKTVHMILKFLLDKEVLSNDASTVEMTRNGYPSVYPCRWGANLDISQIEWALKNGSWWFIGPIRQLKIRVAKGKRKKISQSDIDLLKHAAKKAKFSLSITR